MTPHHTKRLRRPVRAPASGDGRRNLVLVQTDLAQERRDFEEIAALAAKQAPEIAVTIVNNRWPFPAIERRLAERPTLIFSPVALQRFKPERGRIYAGRSLGKMQEYELLRAAGIPVPYSALLTPDFKPDQELLGPIALVKPVAGITSHGLGIKIMRTHRVRYMAPAEYPEDHPGRLYPMVVQQFIDTGLHPAQIRVQTLFGEPLFSTLYTLLEPRASLDAPDDEIEGSQVATNGAPRIRALTVVDADALALAKKVYAAAPALAFQGVDIVRDQDGKLWVLEINSLGNGWHFSSEHGFQMRLAIAAGAGAKTELTETGRRLMIDQYGAFETAARLLVERTRAEAV